MLAEPKYRQKYSLNPRGLDWSQDDSKIGQKMLEKMGWKKGSGLGRNENGEAEPIKVSTKNDRKGVGCTVKNANNWIAHQDDFASILAGLNADTSGSQDNAEASVVASFSLEEKSRSSRSRVHYQKFAKGKDLSRYETADLQSIFGQRKKQSSVDNEDDTISAVLNPATSTEDRSFGVVTVTNTTSISNYFAQKMAEIKQRLAGNGAIQSSITTAMEAAEPDSEGMLNSEEASKKKRLIEECTIGDEEVVEVPSKKKKKRRSDSVNKECDPVERHKSKKHLMAKDAVDQSVVSTDISANSGSLVIVVDDDLTSVVRGGFDLKKHSVKISKRESGKNRKLETECLADSDMTENIDAFPFGDRSDVSVQGVKKVSKKNSRKLQTKSTEFTVDVDLTKSPCTVLNVEEEEVVEDLSLKISRKESRKYRKLAAEEVSVVENHQTITPQNDNESARDRRRILKRESRKNRPTTSAEAPVDVDLTQLPDTEQADARLDDDKHTAKISRKKSRESRRTAGVSASDVDLTVDNELDEIEQPSSRESDDVERRHSRSSKKKKSRK